MPRRGAQLPKNLPDRTKYVVEGRAQTDGVFHVLARYIVLPDGQRIDLSAQDVNLACPPQSSRARRLPSRQAIKPQHARSRARRRAA
jgi:hypothetical protein